MINFHILTGMTMARTVRDTNLESRAARSKLTARHHPYFRSIDQGCHVGYRKGARSASWIARYFIGSSRYHTTKLGDADDVTDADGVKILSWSQAQEKARAWFSEQAHVEAGLGTVGPFTVADAINDYLADYKARKNPSRSTYNNLLSQINTYILPGLEGVIVKNLQSRTIREWHQHISNTPAKTRSHKITQTAELSDDPEIKRKRRHTANKALTTLKAALNHAWREGKVASDTAWRRVKPFQQVASPKIRFLTDDEITRLLNASPSAFRTLLQGALLTGCRYGELCRLVAADFEPESGTLSIKRSKSGKSRNVVLTGEGVELFSNLSLTKRPSDHLFTHDDGTPWAKNHQQRPMAEACSAASITPAINFHILRHTHASRLAMAGAPMGVIATQLGHADTRMTEIHYAHLAPSYVADTIRATFGRIGSPLTGNVAQLKHKAV
ncbi:tyrosine-type recombinase/integrase [Magnetofaba australis]|uniref:Putative integrase family protein n=1 Tax=Magnetofaba australis IT-1 TaxID=1434232 RepID=A0A1Y2K527_9PROT|nr:site-specific integrase [Magnetofaba australis]OSM04336.1 putative integrase family protein [Magnetofaba australis IT-1]